MEMKLQLREMEDSKSSFDKAEHMGTRIALPVPRMPPFSSGEDLYAYLIRFERFARAKAWPNSDYSTNLSLCLSSWGLLKYIIDCVQRIL